MSESVVGIKGNAERIVDESQLAITLGSGNVRVFGTPAMIALVEAAAVNALQVSNLLKSEETSVGTNVSVSHLAPTPVGLKVTAEATITAVQGRKVTFSVTVHDEVSKIGEGTHERVVVNKENFEKKADAKKV